MILIGLSPIGKAWENSHFATAISAISGHPGLTRNVFFCQILRPTIGQHQLPARAVRPSMSVRTWSFGFMIQDQAPSHQAIKELDRLSGRANLQEPFVSRSKSGVSCTFSNKICEQRHLSAKKKTSNQRKKTSCSALCRIGRAL